MRAMEAAARRQQRDAKKRQRELERQTKEAAKLSALEQARLEVETYDSAPLWSNPCVGLLRLISISPSDT